MKKIIAGVLVGGASLMGLGLGAGHAEAKIEPGHYVMQTIVYGAVPSPESNVKVVGNKLFADYYGVGPQNTYTYGIASTKNGGIISYGDTNPASQWFTRTEFRKTRNGYVGRQFAYGGIPTGTVYLKKTTRHANQPR
ncbi:hypothetical protein [Gordonia otitidis]|uniref:Uncharacterized protein n=1 Tax=Gordonia otitidis (strain DSM 44809 / CCUG 52243 / JCM 12355 / NBRC 100426 / IFM 10032) TaxID=1108044 RepID=H5TMT3_GORO1|nr:hypothetical protein [Gordonia otitidis]UEA60109.1 hypothetical protein LK459_04295 [Gordonia otitidis]GAB34791.1 hypothetical protein GOOTI_123_00050 [Gordonia otitidis NBRC 100426]